MTTQKYREIERKENYDRRLHEILEAGKNLFIEKGLASANMKEVAESAKVSRATLYRYFSSKEDLALAIVFHYYRNIMLPHYQELIKQAKGNGFEKVKYLLELRVMAYKEIPDYFKFTGTVDHYFNYHSNPEELAAEMKEIFQKDYTIYSLTDFLSEGMGDGSIRNDIDPVNTAKMLDQVMLSICQRIASRDQVLSHELDLKDSDIIIDTLVTTLLNGLKKD